MTTLTLSTNQVSTITFVPAGSRITSTGNGSIEWTPGSPTDAANSPNWQTWAKGSSAGYMDTLRPVSIRATATGSMTVTIEEGRGDKYGEDAYFDADYPTFATDSSGNVTGLVGRGTGLNPTGYDQTSEIQQYMNDTSGSFLHADFSVGDFIINGQITLNARGVDPVEGKGYGLRMIGMGPDQTRFLDVRSDKTEPAFLVTEPSGVNVGDRAILAKFADFALLSASTSGVPLSLTDAPDGAGFMTKAVVGSGYGAHVLHSGEMTRVRFSGHAYPVSLCDTTQFEFDNCRWTRFLTGVRLGMNCDIISFLQPSFGSESSNSDASWMNTTCIENYWDSGVAPGPGGENVLIIDRAWAMRLGNFIVNKNNVTAGTNIRVRDSYFEGVRRYYYANHSDSVGAYIEFDNNHFSLMGVNDVVSNDPDSVDYAARFQFGATGINRGSSNGPTPYLVLRNNYGTGAHINSLVSINNRAGTIQWENNSLPAASGAGAGLGHLRCIRTGYNTYRTVRSPASNASVSAKFGGGGAGGLGKLSGESIIKTGSVAAGATYSIHLMDGDRHEITLPDGDCTIDILAYSTTAPSNLVHRGGECEVYLIAPASITANRTITFGPRVLMDTGTMAMLTTDKSKVAVFRLKAYSDSGNRMMQDGAFPVFNTAT